MDYLCMVVQRKVTKREGFGSREQAWEYFREHFGEDCYIEEKWELKKNFQERLLSGEGQPMLHLAGIYRRGSVFGFWRKTICSEGTEAPGRRESWRPGKGFLGS